MRRLISLIIFCCIMTSVDIAGAAAIYRWRDAAGALHFSNRVEATPGEAREVILPPLPARAPAVPPAIVAARPVSAGASETRRSRPTRATAACGVADVRGVADAVAGRLAAHRLDGLTLIVGGMPIAYGPDTRIDVKEADADVRTIAPAEQAAIAYPEGSRCPTRPPLERYAVSSGRRAPSRRLCDDYRRAFAQVGVAVSRDQGVAGSFREAAERFVDVASRGYTAGGPDAVVVPPSVLTTLAYAPEARVPLSPWVVEAHIAQTRELDAESSGLVDELSVALEEIDSAARHAGCW